MSRSKKKSIIQNTTNWLRVWGSLRANNAFWEIRKKKPDVFYKTVYGYDNNNQGT